MTAGVTVIGGGGAGVPDVDEDEDAPKLCNTDWTVEFEIVCALTSARFQHIMPATAITATSATRTRFDDMRDQPRKAGRPFDGKTPICRFYSYPSGGRKFKKRIDPTTGVAHGQPCCLVQEP